VKRVAVIAIVALAACSSDPEVERRSAVEHGKDLFSDPKISTANKYGFSCSTCHRAEAAAGDTRLLPGYDLGGAVDRPTFWGGQRSDLLQAINDCRYLFMNAPQAWRGDEEEAKAVFAYLVSVPKTQSAAIPMTILAVAQDLPGGDRARGEQVYDGACRVCHGAAHTARGRLKDTIPLLPEESADSFVRLYNFDKSQVRVTFIEKVRHGGFLGLYGNMPLYTYESMSDADLSALLTFLDLY